MSRIIVITSGKGGVGKTTISAGLGVALAQLDFSVCLIDADLGLKNLDLILGVESRVVYDIADVFSNRASLEKALVRDKKYPNLSLLPACKSLEVGHVEFQQMQKVIHQLRAKFDYLLIDCPAGIERGFYNAIKSATEAIVVCTLDIASIRDADKVVGLLQAASIGDVKVIINRVNPDAIATNVSLTVEDALEVLSIPLLGVVYEDEMIRSNANLKQASLIKERSNGGRCFQNIVRRLKGEEVDLAKFKKKSFLSRILG